MRQAEAGTAVDPASIRPRRGSASPWRRVRKESHELARPQSPAEHPPRDDRSAALPAVVRVRGAATVSPRAVHGRGESAHQRGLVPSPLHDVGGVRAEPHLSPDRAITRRCTVSRRRTGWRRAQTAPTCSGSRRTRCRRSATGSARAATGPSTRASGMCRTRASTTPTARVTSCRSTTTGLRSRRTSPPTSKRTCSMNGDSRSGSGPTPTASASTTPRRSRMRSRPTRPSPCSNDSITRRATSPG